MKKYDSYKDSGVEWIGEIPISWNKIKFSYVTKLMTCGHAATPEYVEDGGVPFLSAQNIKNEKIDLNVLKHVTVELHDSLIKNKKVEKGDLLQVRVGGADTIGQTAIVDLDFDFSIYVSLAHIKLNELAFNGYVKHLCNSVEFKEYCGVLMKKGAGVANLNVSDVASMKIPLPNFEEQTIIANYLDHKTTQIDHLIVKKEQFIQLLEEERVAVINQAVTKGLDPNVSMKDSGIEWLGEIPEHWEVKKLKYVCSTISNKAKTKPNFVLALENIESWTGKIVGDPYSNSMEGEVQLFQEGDILFNKLRPYLAKVCLAKKEGGAIGELLVLRPFEIINSGFLFQRLRSEMIITIVDGSTYGTKMPRASWDKFISQLEIGVPPMDEQYLIEKYIIKNEIRISELALKTKQEIELLNEYKTALISEVVTGKVDVRDYSKN